MNQNPWTPPEPMGGIVDSGRESSVLPCPLYRFNSRRIIFDFTCRFRVLLQPTLYQPLRVTTYVTRPVTTLPMRTHLTNYRGACYHNGKSKQIALKFELTSNAYPVHDDKERKDRGSM